MNGLRRISCLFLSFAVLITAVFGSVTGFIKTNAAQPGYVNGTNVRIREDAGTNFRQLAEISNVYVTINGEKTGTDGKLWYEIEYGGIHGYMHSDYVVKVEGVSSDRSFEEQISAFPESYKTALRALHSIYPNWKFYADNINMTLDELAKLEVVCKVTDDKSISWRSMDKGSYDWGSGNWVSEEDGRWHYASREVIKYYMDPRNFLNEQYIYTYMKQNYDPSSQNEEGVRKIVSGTFLENGYYDPNDTAYGGSYIAVIMEAARQSGINPYILAATIIQEQGTKGTSGIIAGPYYNFFNISANGNDPVTSGINYAKNKGWNTRSKSIIEGAQFSGNNYVSAGQNTYFYINYNIKDPKNLWHQYAAAVYNATSSGGRLVKTYKDLKSAELDFLIPVYQNMSDTASQLPEKNGNLNNYYFDSISAVGLTPSFDRFIYNDYSLKVSGDSTIYVKLPESAEYAGDSSYNLNSGSNRITLRVKSQSGYYNEYYIDVSADSPCRLTVSAENNSASVVRKGDTNGDGKVTLIDLANVQRHLLGLISLTGNNFAGADTNSDGKISLIDLANIQRYLLGLLAL